MWKKFFFTGIILVMFIAGIVLFYGNRKRKADTSFDEEKNIVVEETEELSKYVTDACLDEWEDYASYVEEEMKETASSVSDEDRVYIVKLNNNIIEVYYLSDNNEEILYKTTDIWAKYLPKEDVENLQNGIKVKGVEKLNQLLEDFE